MENDAINYLRILIIDLEKRKKDREGEFDRSHMEKNSDGGFSSHEDEEITHKHTEKKMSFDCSLSDSMQ